MNTASLLIVLVAIAAGVWFFLSHKPQVNARLAKSKAEIAVLEAQAESAYNIGRRAISDAIARAQAEIRAIEAKSDAEVALLNAKTQAHLISTSTSSSEGAQATVTSVTDQPAKSG